MSTYLKAVVEDIKSRLTDLTSAAPVPAEVVRNRFEDAFFVTVIIGEDESAQKKITLMAEALSNEQVRYSIVDGTHAVENIELERFYSVVEEELHFPQAPTEVATASGSWS